MSDAFQLGYKVTKLIIRDRALATQYERNVNAALRRFGSIVRREGRRLIKPARGKRVRVIDKRTGEQLVGKKAKQGLADGTAKTRGRAMAAGSPPIDWTQGDRVATLRNIVFGKEGDDTIVIGPVHFGKIQRPTIPEKIEHGLGGYRKFPFMGPAMEAKRDELLKSLLKFGVIG